MYPCELCLLGTYAKRKVHTKEIRIWLFNKWLSLLPFPFPLPLPHPCVIQANMFSLLPRKKAMFLFQLRLRERMLFAQSFMFRTYEPWRNSGSNQTCLFIHLTLCTPWGLFILFPLHHCHLHHQLVNCDGMMTCSCHFYPYVFLNEFIATIACLPYTGLLDGEEIFFLLVGLFHASYFGYITWSLYQVSLYSRNANTHIATKQMRQNFQLNEQERMIANKNILVVNVYLVMMCFFTT